MPFQDVSNTTRKLDLVKPLLGIRQLSQIKVVLAIRILMTLVAVLLEMLIELS